jgi:predicted ATPase
VQLERFKAVYKPAEVKLRPFTVLIGRNGSGKSTLIEALQWIDTAIRRDAREASDRYLKFSDLINYRSRTNPLYFVVRLGWGHAETADSEVEYEIKVQVARDGANPEIAEEHMRITNHLGSRDLIATRKGARQFLSPDGKPRDTFAEPERLALARGPVLSGDPAEWYFEALRTFWAHAVFLRLSTNRLAQGSPPRRKSFDPLLDEEGQNLPALLNELTDQQTEELTAAFQQIMPDIQGVEVSRPTTELAARVHYSLREQMPYRGRSGRKAIPVPAWMLSEGTRRITAILALLHHDPLPTFLCVEEIENGLDPWTVITVLNQLRSAADRGVQIILTTHSPWLLDHVEVNSILHVQRTQGETVYTSFADRAEVKRYAQRVPPGAIYVNEEP